MVHKRDLDKKAIGCFHVGKELDSNSLREGIAVLTRLLILVLLKLIQGRKQAKTCAEIATFSRTHPAGTTKR